MPMQTDSPRCHFKCFECNELAAILSLARFCSRQAASSCAGSKKNIVELISLPQTHKCRMWLQIRTPKKILVLIVLHLIWQLHTARVWRCWPPLWKRWKVTPLVLIMDHHQLCSAHKSVPLSSGLCAESNLTFNLSPSSPLRASELSMLSLVLSLSMSHFV